MPLPSNTSLFFPISGQTISGVTNSPGFSYTARANGAGAIVYISGQGAGTFTVTVNSQTVVSRSGVNTGAINILMTPETNGIPGFPTDRNGVPYLLLAPGATVNLSTSTGGNYGSITALEL